MKWYHAQYGGSDIKEVEVERFTDKRVWINGRQSARYTDSSGFHESKDEAIAATIAYHERGVRQAQSTLEYYTDNLAEAKKKLGV